MRKEEHKGKGHGKAGHASKRHHEMAAKKSMEAARHGNEAIKHLEKMKKAHEMSGRASERAAKSMGGADAIQMAGRENPKASGPMGDKTEGKPKMSGRGAHAMEKEHVGRKGREHETAKSEHERKGEKKAHDRYDRYGRK